MSKILEKIHSLSNESVTMVTITFSKLNKHIRLEQKTKYTDHAHSQENS